MNRNSQLWFRVFMMLVGFAAEIAAFYIYFSDGDMHKAIFWLVFGIGCEVTIVRRDVNEQ